MKISNLNAAKSHTYLKLICSDDLSDELKNDFKSEPLIRICSLSSMSNISFILYGGGIKSEKQFFCSANRNDYDELCILEDSQEQNCLRYLLQVHEVNGKAIVVQVYIFKTITEYKTPINIIVSDILSNDYSIEDIQNEFVWKQLGEAAIFVTAKKSKYEYITILGGKRKLLIETKSKDIIARKIEYNKNKSDLPVDVYIAPEIIFCSWDEYVRNNPELYTTLETISSPSTYFTRWEAYNELSKKVLQQENEEFGEYKYINSDAHPSSSGTEFKFEIAISDNGIDNGIIGKELGIGISDSSRNTCTASKILNGKQIYAGRITRIGENYIETISETSDSDDPIPNNGVLQLYTAGDEHIMKRRLAARERMMKGRAPIRYIVSLIENGTAKFMNDPSSWENNKAVSQKLERNFHLAKDLNIEQKKALEVAINTPDIALIQGPPGTGKTTVIKAICERFREIFESNEERHHRIDAEYTPRVPRILISSFQNEAVDNAVSGPTDGDMPAFRKAAAYRKNDKVMSQYQNATRKWFSELNTNLKNKINSNAINDYFSRKSKLDDEFFAYLQTGKNLERGKRIIEDFLSYRDIPYPEAIKRDVRDILNSISAVQDDDIIKRFLNLLDLKCTSLDFNKTDVSNRAGKIMGFIKNHKNDIELSKEICNLIDEVAYSDENDDLPDETYNKFFSEIEALKDKYAKEQNSNEYNELLCVCIEDCRDFFSRHYIETLTSIEDKKSLILYNFINRLEVEQESVIEKYSSTIAATCQACLDLRYGEEETYDLVIVDEAARANPLDLFIPISMGRKVILVGDHKQLPHMLEPDVLKLLENDTRFQEIPELEKSLFERLFNLFNTEQNPKSVLLTQQYRMHPEICNFVSSSFYDENLTTSECINAEMRAPSRKINNGHALAYINVPYIRGGESKGASKYRIPEVEAIGKDVKLIIKNEPEASIGIITFYSAQASCIKKQIDDLLNDDDISRIEIGTVDAFQGKEFDYVLLSCVRSNPQKGDKTPNVGFLEKSNRLCVAMSRAKRQLSVYGDIDTLKQIPCFAKLYELCHDKKVGAYREY